MNSYDLNCYQKTYKDENFWQDTNSSSEDQKRQDWSKCRGLTDSFYDELIKRGYLVRIKK